jgi:CHAT domain-containing protein
MPSERLKSYPHCLVDRDIQEKKCASSHLVEAGKKSHLAHLATHSGFNEQDYLDSWVQFHREWLTVARLISDEELDFSGMRLFYLSSCESGKSELGVIGDELQGLVWSLFYAGARAVMASLWPVDDTAAYYMAHRFYYHYLENGQPLAKAHHMAINDLRRDYQNKFPDNPYFWAPFVLYGDGWGA